jgi:hypothetical protein
MRNLNEIECFVKAIESPKAAKITSETKSKILKNLNCMTFRVTRVPIMRERRLGPLSRQGSERSTSG